MAEAKKSIKMQMLLTVLVLVAIIISGGTLAYVTGLMVLPARIEALASTTEELVVAEKELASSMVELGKAVGAETERIRAIEKRIEALEEIVTRPAPKIKTVTIWAGMAELARSEALDKLIMDFEKQNPDIMTSVTYLPWETFREKLKTVYTTLPQSQLLIL